MSLMVKEGDEFMLKGRRVTVTALAFESLPGVRGHLIDVARAGNTVTYGELVSELSLRYRPQGLGRLLDLLSVDCDLRGEPSLAAIVVNEGTGEVGHDFARRCHHGAPKGLQVVG